MSSPQRTPDRSLHKLKITTARLDDNSIASICQAKATQLRLSRGDIVMLRGRRQKATVCVVVLDDAVDPDNIAVNRCTQRNLCVSEGFSVSVFLMNDVAFGRRVQLSPLDDTLTVDASMLGRGHLIGSYLRPYFRDAYRPIAARNIYTIKGINGDQIDFKVMTSEPTPFCIVSPQTIIEALNSIRREVENPAMNIFYTDIGGLTAQLTTIREMVDLPLIRPEPFDELGMRRPKGLLLSGPPGTGKTLIARAIANETAASFYVPLRPGIVSFYAGGSEAHLRQIFDTARRNSPSIVFIDELDAIAPKRNNVHGELEKRIVSQLLTLMDGLESSTVVLVIGATNRPNSIDSALRRPGRFDRELHIGLPDRDGRLEILQIHSRKMKLNTDVNLAQIADATHGHVGADLAQLCWEAGYEQIREKLPMMDLDRFSIEPEILNSLSVTHANFLAALERSRPASLRETAIEIPNVTWEDVGGMEPVRQTLEEIIIHPIQHPDLYRQFGMSASKGLLFFGPPGCGKTLLAKAVATQHEANFISVKGPQLLTMWFGESEANVRDIFDKARNAAPCILFFDEFDAIAQSRNGSGGGNIGSRAGERVVAQLLTEMDGIGENKNVIVICATNRPDILDPAILRPGRIDQLVYIPLPDEPSRLSILRALLRKSPVAQDVNLAMMARRLVGFSGADLAELCKRACRLAIRECIARMSGPNARPSNLNAHGTAGNTGSDNSLNSNNGNTNGAEGETRAQENNQIRREHFEEAMRDVRRSVSNADVEMYENMRRTLQSGQDRGRDNQDSLANMYT